MNLDVFKDIEAFLFDLGGVIIDINVKRTIDAFAELGLAGSDLQLTQSHHSGLFKAFERGEMTNQEFLNSLKEEVDDGTTEEGLINAWNLMLVNLPAERVRILEYLHGCYPTYILSNTNDIHLQKFRYMAEGCEDIEQLFTGVFYSFRLGCSKPEKEAFQKVIDSTGINPHTTLFLDDSEVNLKVASELGFKTQLVSAQNPIEKIFGHLMA